MPYATNKIPMPAILDGLKPEPARKTSYDLPRKEAIFRMAMVCVVGSLAWDYADTVLQIAARLRTGDTKKVSRAIRELKSQYDRLHLKCLERKEIMEISKLSGMFEELCTAHFNKLCNGLKSDPCASGLDADNAMLVKAVQMALTVLDALQMYASRCDRWMASHGVHGHSIMPSPLRRLQSLLPLYAGDRYNPHAAARELTSKILFNEILKIERHDESDPGHRFALEADGA